MSDGQPAQSQPEVPLNRAPLFGLELEYIKEVVFARSHKGDGKFTRLCHEWLENRLSTKKVLLTHSCTAALEMAALLCDLQPGDEVIMPSYTFVSTANAVVLRGAIPVFVDVEWHTANIAAHAIEAAITPRTRAVFVVHYAGVPCDMDAINAIAAKNGLLVVEDAAQALGSTYKHRPVGSLGDLAAFSFHETKNVVSGEGGALAIQKNELGSRAEIIREKGTNRNSFLRGETDKYTWVDVGSSYLPSDIIAAFLFGQLQHTDEINEDRLRIWGLYHQALEPLEQRGLISRPVVPEYAIHNGHIYHFKLESRADRDKFLSAMRAQDIVSVFHYVPLHSSPAGKRYGRVSGEMNMTDQIGDRLVRLPIYFGMGTDAERVIDTVNRYFG